MPPTSDEHSIVHIGRHADCAGRLSGQLMKTMRPIQGRIFPSHNARGAQQKDGHRKIPHRCATAVRGPAGGVFLASLNASHDRFFLPTFAALIPHFHNRRAYARRLCTFGAGMRASRRAPPGFAGLTPPRNGEARAIACNRAAAVRLRGNSGWTPDPESRGARAATLSCRRGIAPHFPTAAGAAGIAGAIPRKWLPPRLRAHAGAWSLWRTAGAPAPASHRTIRRLTPRLLRGLANGWGDGSPPLAPGIAARFACLPSPLQSARCGAHPFQFFSVR